MSPAYDNPNFDDPRWVVVVCKPILLFSLGFDQAEQYIIIIILKKFFWRTGFNFQGPYVSNAKCEILS